MSRRKRLKARLAILLLTPFEAAIAFAAMFSAAVYLFDPAPIERSVLGRAARDLLPVWEALYVAGGATILIGLIAPSVRLEVAGLSLFIAAMAIQSFAIVDVAGTQGIVAAATFTAIAFAAAGRGWTLILQWRNARRDGKR